MSETVSVVHVYVAHVHQVTSLGARCSTCAARPSSVICCTPVSVSVAQSSRATTSFP
jgi:hypothetical protein